jgi:methyl-accepting chemotaxis protein
MLRNMKIGVRLGAGFGVILLMMLCLIFVGVTSLKRMDGQMNNIVEVNYAKIHMAKEASDSILDLATAIPSMVVLKDKTAKIEEKNRIAADRAAYNENIDKLEKLETTQKGKDIIAKVKDAIESAKKADNGVIDLSLAGETDKAASIYVSEAEPRLRKIHEALDEMVKYQEDNMDASHKDAESSYSSTRGFIFIIGGASVGLIVLISFFITRSLTRPIRSLAEVATNVANGDLTRQVAVDSNDEVGALGLAVNMMVDKLKEMIGTVNQTAAQVASAADQVNAGAASITRGAQTQASAAEETSSSMEEMAASIQTVAQNAGVLASNVEETSASINQMVASIEEVAKNSDVMASSVSETSATIEQMTASIDRVARDTDTLSVSVEETSATIEQMVASINQVAKNADVLASTVSETSSTIEEMAASIKQVAQNVSQADLISQQAAVEAKAGSEAVEMTIEGINRISDTMAITSKVMDSLGKRSEEIGKIVEVIEEIADQTNLLALNAAIEAARAGDAGRGFAVVADEVRKLAERSVVATKEISSVIKQVQKETEQAVRTTEMGASETREGIKLADKAGAALKRILDSVNSTNILMSQINNASDQQAGAAAQVLRTVENMNQATDQVTTAVKEQAMGTSQIRSAVENMNRVTQQLAGAMKEQSSGGKQIRAAVEDMNRVTGQVSIATNEQASGSAQILRAVDNMNGMTQQVANATSEQKRGGELVVKAVENISDIARENLTAVQEMSKAAENLTYQAESLQRAVSVFKTTEITSNCWDILHCANEFRFKCPAYQNKEKRCWLIEATWCKGVQQGDARSKLANCMHCQAFKVMQGINYLPASTGKSIGSGSQV